MTNEITGFCLRCKKKVLIKNMREEKNKRGLRVAKGVCPVCNTKICKILGK